MEGLEITVLLGLAILAGTALAPRLRVATPLLLVVIGLLLGFVPALREIQLPPETVLLLFLPVMLFWESLTTSLRAIRRSLRYIVPMSTLLVVASAFAVAGIASAFGMPWQTGLLLGAAVAPPDATAVAALGRLLPQRMFMKLKAESLTNDGTALVVYAIALSVALGDDITPWSITATVLVSYLGGAAAGIAVAALAYLALRRAHSAIVINTTLLLVPFTAFLLAELIGASGVLAVVFAGLIVAWMLPRITTAASRRQANAAWPFGVYLLNGALFVLIGLEVQYVVNDIPGRLIGTLLLVSVAAWIALIVVRYLFLLLFAPFSPPAGGQLFGDNRARIVNTMAGFRGAVSLAIALSVPVTVNGSGDLSGRDAIVFVTAGVILLSLLVQGPLLPAIVRWARLPEDAAAEEEYELAQRAISGAALAALDDIAASTASAPMCVTALGARATRCSSSPTHAPTRGSGSGRPTTRRSPSSRRCSMNRMPPTRAPSRRSARYRRAPQRSGPRAARPRHPLCRCSRRATGSTSRSARPSRSTRRRRASGSPCWIASAPSCTGCGARARSTTSSCAASRPTSTSKRCG
ncbi:Na+/H+ antiporter [Microbacterium aurum]